jgi:hypothetical protein
MKRTVAELNEAKRLKREQKEAQAGELVELFQLFQAQGRTIRTLIKQTRKLEEYLSRYLGWDVRR